MFSSMERESFLQDLKRQRRDMVYITKLAKQGHLSSSFSVLEILNVLYKRQMAFDINNPSDYNNDRCILSKGHAGLALYALFKEIGIISEEDFQSFSKYNSILGEHPDRNKIPGVDVSTGSLGHGLPCGVGLATAFKSLKLNNKVFVIIGDGEANEGSVWEAALIADRLNLSNLVCIVDNNNSESYTPYLLEKFSSFGWDAYCIKNGNDIDQIESALHLLKDKPLALIANTIKGYGSKTMMDDPEGWHHKVPSDEEYTRIMGELK